MAAGNRPRDTIVLKGLSAYGHHGVFDDERAAGQMFVVDVLAHLDSSEAVASDDLTKTVDYGQVAAEVVAVVAGPPVQLIEALAGRIAEVVLAHKRIEAVEVTVHKAQAPIPVEFTDVFVTIRRERADFEAADDGRKPQEDEKPAEPEPSSGPIEAVAATIGQLFVDQEPVVPSSASSEQAAPPAPAAPAPAAPAGVPIAEAGGAIQGGSVFPPVPAPGVGAVPVPMPPVPAPPPFEPTATGPIPVGLPTASGPIPVVSPPADPTASGPIPVAAPPASGPIPVVAEPVAKAPAQPASGQIPLVSPARSVPGPGVEGGAEPVMTAPAEGEQVPAPSPAQPEPRPQPEDVPQPEFAALPDAAAPLFVTPETPSPAAPALTEMAAAPAPLAAPDAQDPYAPPPAEGGAPLTMPLGSPLDLPPAPPADVVLALGGNVGDVPATLRQAITHLASVDGLDLLTVSPLARTAPVGDASQPDFFNCVVIGRSSLSPRALLAQCQRIENLLGRVREEKWGPRTIDIDIVTFGSIIAVSDDLTIPHPLAAERAFVLLPWANAAPHAILPGVGGGPVAQLAEAAPDRAGVRWLSLDWVGELSPIDATGAGTTTSS